MKATFALFTYKEHIPKEALQEHFRKLVPSTKEVYIAHEIGDTGYPHTHAVVDFGAQITRRSATWADFTLIQELPSELFDASDSEEEPFEYNESAINIHANIRMLPGRKAFNDALKYISKQDETAIPTNRSLFDQVVACSSKQEALKLANRFSDASGIITMWKNRAEMQVEKLPLLIHNWQSCLAEELTTEAPDERMITWYVDFKGNTGKTYFCNYMLRQHQDRVIVMTTFNGVANTANLVKNMMNDGITPDIFLIDLPRQAEDNQIYGALEGIKNGMLTNTKYEASLVLFNTPHVVVFANWLPKLKMLSLDRWKIHELYGKMDTDQVFVKTKNVQKILDEQEKKEEEEKEKFNVNRNYNK